MINTISSTQAASPLTTGNNAKVSDILVAESIDPRSKYYGQFSDQEVKAAFDSVNERETAGFGYTLGDQSLEGERNTISAYIKYLNSLSPEEQNSIRYKGAKERMTAVLAKIEGEIARGAGSGKKSKIYKSDIEKMMEDVIANFKELKERSAQPANATNSTDKVTISEEAGKYTKAAQSPDSTET